MKQMNLKKTRYLILEKAKPHIIKGGWNEKLFFNISKSSTYSLEEINILFPEGYSTLVQMYLDQINDKMIDESKKIDLIRLRVHLRIRELIILKLKIMKKQKQIVSKTLTYLLLPNNYKMALKNLYKTADEIWFLAGDNSSDFNYYTKRSILSSIYFSVMIHFVNNDNLDETIEFLDKQLKTVSKIPKLKNKLRDLTKILPQLIKIGKNFSFIKQ